MKAAKFMPVLLAFILTVAGCEKDPAEQSPSPESPPANKVTYLLDSIKNTSPFSSKNVYYYNTDSTIKQIDYSGRGVAYSYLFTYDNKHILQHHVYNPWYISRYTYVNGKIVLMEDLDVVDRKRGYKLEYTYNNNGTVATLKYSTVNEAGAKLIYTSTYKYDNAGDLHTIESIANNNSKVVWTIESYSAPCDFDPIVFTSTTLDEFYALYNYPVLSQLKKLPAKMTYATATSSGIPAVVEKIYERIYSMSNKRIDKITSVVKFVNNPNDNTSMESEFYYRQ